MHAGQRNTAQHTVHILAAPLEGNSHNAVQYQLLDYSSHQKSNRPLTPCTLSNYTGLHSARSLEAEEGTSTGMAKENVAIEDAFNKLKTHIQDNIRYAWLHYLD